MRIIDYSYNFPKETKEKIVKYNKLIAQYMGYTYFPHNHINKNGKLTSPGWKVHENVDSMSKMNRNINDYLCRNHNALAYHFDWNWLSSVIVELFKRNGYIVYTIGQHAYSWHHDDFVMLNSNAAGDPKYYSTFSTVQNVEDRIVATWEVLALTIEHLITMGYAKIPTVTEYKMQLFPGHDMSDDDIKRFRDDLDNLSGKKD